jgi:four helix bundle protein
MEQSILKEKSFRFSLTIIELCRLLKETRKEYVLQNQLLRSGTAVGALIREAEFAQSRADFISKLSIALK